MKNFRFFVEINTASFWLRKVYLVKIIKKSNLAHLKVNAFLSMVTWQQFIDQKNCEKRNQTICDINQHLYLWIDVMQKKSLAFYLIIFVYFANVNTYFAILET